MHWLPIKSHIIFKLKRLTFTNNSEVHGLYPTFELRCCIVFQASFLDGGRSMGTLRHSQPGFILGGESLQDATGQTYTRYARYRGRVVAVRSYDRPCMSLTKSDLHHLKAVSGAYNI